VLVPSSILEEELLLLQQKNLYRKCRVLKESSGTRATFEGREVLLFCGNDYLGLSQEPRVIAAAKQAAERYGIGSGAARLISGTSDLHVQLEEKIAQLKNKESALLFTAGYLANLGVVTALAREKDLLVMDKLCHASLIDGARLSGAQVRVFPHKNYVRCEEILESAKGFGKKILVSDTVFSMDGDLADFKELVRLKEKYDALLILDDAHGTGVFGSKGSGLPEDPALAKKVDVTVGTLSKAFGCIGGFATGSKKTMEYLINFSRPFIFATAMPPMICAAANEALEILSSDASRRERLWKNAKMLHVGLAECGFKMGSLESPILPIIIGDEAEALRLSEALLQQGILIPAIRTPSVPKGQARLRVTVSAAHEQRDLEQLLKLMRTFI
jgi:8-amino-7-oxononanoate synthase